MTWCYLRRDGFPAATDEVIGFIRHVAARHGGEAKFNETMTRFWTHAVALAMAVEGDDFDRLLERHPQLTDRSLPYRHWSRKLLGSPEAKARWVDPDLRPLPPVARLQPPAGPLHRAPP